MLCVCYYYCRYYTYINTCEYDAAIVMVLHCTLIDMSRTNTFVLDLWLQVLFANIFMSLCGSLLFLTWLLHRHLTELRMFWRSSHSPVMVQCSTTRTFKQQRKPVYSLSEISSVVDVIGGHTLLYRKSHVQFIGHVYSNVSLY